ncbi:MAG: 4'-phosphopantetheinyl transferase superfamily protein [Pseudomonadota bacterium]|nr:4'-phosphopantetheinyl transferase superfamily protein [Pseudomonadota bacterium]
MSSRIDENPAVLSPSLASLFPPGALAAQLRTPGDPALLLPEEVPFLGRAVPARAQEFAAGRLCARRLFGQFNLGDCPLTVGVDRQPIWPPSLVGSITHTSGFCAAVVAQRARIAALGIDCEVIESVKEGIWPHIFRAAEVLWLTSLPHSQQGAAATLVFSAKEAFYKCQYPLVGERLGFHDACVEVSDWGSARGTFTIEARRKIDFASHAELPLQGRYLFHDNFITTGIALKARVL